MEGELSTVVFTGEDNFVFTDAEIDELIDKIYQFTLEATGVKLFPYQAEFAKRIVRSLISGDGEEITALFSRQSERLKRLRPSFPASSLCCRCCLSLTRSTKTHALRSLQKACMSASSLRRMS